MKTMNSTKLDGDGFSSTVETQAGLGATLLIREPRSREKSNYIVDVIKSDGAISNVASCHNGRTVTLDYKTEFDSNPKFSAFRCYFFLVLHCLSGYYFGYSMTCLNNLGKPILRDMGITDEKDISSSLGSLNLAFGITKVVASILGGSYQKSVGKLNLLLITEPLGIISTVLCCMGNIWVFSAGRVLNAFYLGFQSTCTPRLIMECFPTARRGSCTAMYGFFVCLGTASSFCLGQFGDNNLQDYWRYMLIFPAVLSVVRIGAVLIFFPYDSPIHYTYRSVQWKEKDPQRARENEAKADLLLEKFNKNQNDIVFEKKQLEEAVSDPSKAIEKGFIDMVKQNCLAIDKRWSFIAVIFFNGYSSWVGQVYLESYTSEIYGKLVDDKFGYTLTFYSAFPVIASGLCAVLFIEKLGRKTIIEITFFMQFACMWALALAFYFNFINMAVVVNL